MVDAQLGGVYDGKYKKVKKIDEVVIDHFNLCYKCYGGLGKHQGAVVACCMVLGNDDENIRSFR